VNFIGILLYLAFKNYKIISFLMKDKESLLKNLKDFLKYNT